MHAQDPFVPDYMMRFAPTPYEWKLSRAAWTTRVESNDLGIALGLRRSWGERLAQVIGHVRLVVDHQFGYGGIGPKHEGGGFQIETGSVRTLFHGAGTVLFYDEESRELFGFLSPEITAADLIDKLMPALIKL